MDLHTYSLTNQNDETIDNFVKTVISNTKNTSDNSISVYPEYCWGDVSEQVIKEKVNIIHNQLTGDQQVILGSHPFKINNKRTNNGIYINAHGTKKYIPKIHVLSEESKRNNVIDGKHPGLIEFNNLKIAIIICGDIWDGKLLQHLLPNADILVVPAFTAVPLGFEGYAKTQWYSIQVVRSREFIIPIIVADHENIHTDIDVGNVTAIADPSLKHENMNDFADFLQLPVDGKVSYSIDFDEIHEYKEYRREKGLYQF